jgi:hypothetical protein
MAAPLLVAVVAEPALAQKFGGILKMYSPDSPASMSVHEEATFVAEGPMMGVFNNLVMFDQHAKQNSLGSIVPDLATSWSWNAPEPCCLRSGITPGSRFGLFVGQFEVHIPTTRQSLIVNEC